MILTEDGLKSLLQVQHRSPHELLGMHPLPDGSSVVVRAFLPGAASVEAVPTHEKDKPRLKLKRIHKDGLFEGVTKEAKRVYAYDLVITDPAGNPLLQLTRPAKVIKSSVIVADGAGTEIGRIVQANVFGKIRFNLEAGGTTVGTINAENWRAWNFRIDDPSGNEVARITKTFEGIATTLFTTADNYVVQMHAQIPQPLLSLVVASALSVDTALKQDSRGLG